ncbi:MAG: VCBS repeat-containing protein [Planctomycetota bacterium]|nr:VCBS repeat-containing protein [Planctomycetota bacterium]
MPDSPPSRGFPFGIILIVLIIVGVPVVAIYLHSIRSGRSMRDTMKDVSGVGGEDVPDSIDSTGHTDARLTSRAIGRSASDRPYITHVTAADLDQDGLLDVLVSDATTNRVSWIRQEAPGQFSERVISPFLMAPARTQVIDIDLDGDLDVLIAGLGSLFPSNEKLGQVLILENNGTESFTPHVVAKRLPRVADVRASDLDGDGDLDLAVAAFGAEEGNLTWLENQGEWNFLSHPLHSLSGTIDVIPEDIDGDGDVDLVCLVSQEWEEIHAYLNDGSGQFEFKLLYGSGNDDYGSSGISLADLDADGDLDLLYTNGDGFDYSPPQPRPWHGVQWLENDGDLNFTFHRLTDFPGAYAPTALDFDGDGDLDLVAVSCFNYWNTPAAQSLIWLENNGDRTFTTHALANDPTHQITIAVGDFNNDGTPDLVTGGMHFYAPYDRIGRITLWTNQSSDENASP